MIKKIKENRKYQVIILVAVMLLSIAFSFVASNPNMYKHTISILDERRGDALLLTASTTAAAVGVSAIPGDTTSPVANLLTDIASYTVLITCILFIEKFLLTTLGLVAFAVFIPVSCFLAIIYLYNKKDIFKSYALKLTIFGIIVAFIIPASTGIGVLVEKTASIDYKEATAELEETTEEISAWEKVKGKTSDLIEYIKEKVNHIIDLVAVMLITTCFIPLGVILFILWLIKILFNIEIKAPNPKKLSSKLNKERKKLFEKEDSNSHLIEQY